jgi:UDP-N-acetylglucosamine acyltransferase
MAYFTYATLNSSTARSTETIIHPTAVVDSSAEIGEGCSVGPYCTIEGNVRLGAGTVLKPHVVIDHDVELGANCRVGSFAVLGQWAQNRQEAEESGRVYIGDGVSLSSGVSIDRGSHGGATQIGSNTMLMQNTHVGHDVLVGEHTTVATGSKLAGYTQVGNHCTLYADTGVQQNVRVGDGVMTGGRSAVRKDIPPYCIADGATNARLRGPNKMKLQSVLQLTEDEITTYRKVLRRLLQGNEDIGAVAAEQQDAYLQGLYTFLRGESAHGVMSW